MKFGRSLTRGSGMTTVSTLLDAYFEVNALLLFTCLLWAIFGKTLDLVGLGHAVTARLRLLRAVFLAVIISPIFVVAFAAVKAGKKIT